MKCDVGTAQCEDETFKCEKKIREPPNVSIELSNVRKKVIEPRNVTKELLQVMLEPHNMRMESSNVRKM